MAGQIQGEASVIFGVETKLEPPPFDASDILKISENGFKMRKLWPPKLKRVKNFKKQNTTKAGP
jgi:hypothetical protein